MNFFIILVVSVIVFGAFRFFFIFLYWLLGKLIKGSTDSRKFDLGMSIAFYWVYICAFIGAVQGVIKSNELSNAEWYFVYTFMGISAMLWCYFSWDMKLKAKPKFGLNDKQIIIKKIMVFACVMAFSFYHGYKSLDSMFSEKDTDLVTTVVNITIIPGVIAFDRLLNQIVNYQKNRNNIC